MGLLQVELAAILFSHIRAVPSAKGSDGDYGMRRRLRFTQKPSLTREGLDASAYQHRLLLNNRPDFLQNSAIPLQNAAVHGIIIPTKE